MAQGTGSEGAVGTPSAVPIPDPTTLTTDQLHREIAILREHLLREIGHLGELTTERFQAVHEKFDVRDTRVAEQKADTLAAVVAAFDSQREAIAKAEAYTTKQIDGLQELFQTEKRATDDTISDLKAQIGRVASEKAGGNEAITASRATTNQLIGIALFVVAVAGLALAIITNSNA